MRVQETDEIYDLAEKSRVEESAPPKRFYRLTTLGRLPSMDETDGYIRLHPVTLPGFGLILVK
jgi:hypothetical protein